MLSAKLNAESAAQNLKDANCSPEVVQAFLSSYREGDYPRLLKILAGHRQVLLHQLHDKQRKLDCLDYLIYRIRKDGKNEIR